MTMTVTKWIMSIMLLALVSACGSTPRSNYYMLSAGAQAHTEAKGPSLGLGPITVPEYLKRREMVLQQSSHKLNVAEFERWAEPLDAGVFRVTSQNLAVLLNTQQIQAFPWHRSSLPDYGISIALVELSIKSGQAFLVAKWTLSNPSNGEALDQHISTFKIPTTGTGPESMAGAYSELLRQLAVEIANVVNQQDS
jgi:uncharacterized lipoprotein YmbA